MRNLGTKVRKMQVLLIKQTITKCINSHTIKISCTRTYILWVSNTYNIGNRSLYCWKQTTYINEIVVGDYKTVFNCCPKEYRWWNVARCCRKFPKERNAFLWDIICCICCSCCLDNPLHPFHFSLRHTQKTAHISHDRWTVCSKNCDDGLQDH